MGTNYYWYKEPACPHCGHRNKPLHIGKSSAGWCFALQVLPEEGLNSLEDWSNRLQTGEIRDEYGIEHNLPSLLSIIQNRRGVEPILTLQYPTTLYAELGPNNLLRSKIDGQHCVGHGEGTWDLIQGDFS